MSAMPSHQDVYRAKLLRVIDGDSLVVEISVGFGLYVGHGNEGAHLRLLGLDCPERNESGWEEAKRFTANWLVQATSYSEPLEWPLVIRTVKADNFGRYLADVFRVSDGAHLNADLLASGLATPYQAAASPVEIRRTT
jgi:micrococcal nuclease